MSYGLPLTVDGLMSRQTKESVVITEGREHRTRIRLDGGYFHCVSCYVQFGLRRDWLTWPAAGNSIVIQAAFWTQMTVELDISFAELNGGSVRNIAGLAIGCILFIPSTMKYGRRPTYIISATIIAAASWWSARVQTLADMYVTNFIYGLESSPNETIAQLTVCKESEMD